LPTDLADHHRWSPPRLSGLRVGDGRHPHPPQRPWPTTHPTRPGAGDKAYSNRAIPSHLRRRQIKATIPEPASQQAHRLRRDRQGGRPPQFDAEIYKQRNVVERAINKLKGYRAVASRYDKRDYMYRGTIDVASIRICSATPFRDPRDTL
jgi:transposase